MLSNDGRKVEFRIEVDVESEKYSVSASELPSLGSNTRPTFATRMPESDHFQVRPMWPVVNEVGSYAASRATSNTTSSSR